MSSLKQMGPVLAGVVALLLWLASAGLAVLAVLGLHAMLLRLYARFSDNWRVAAVLDNALLIVFGILWLGFVIGSAEYHRKRVGQRSSWRVFFWSYVILLIVLALPLYI